MSQVKTQVPLAINHAAVVRLALPMVLAHLSTPLLGFVDATIIGRLGEAYLLGATATASILFDFIFWGFGFLRMGTASLTAQAIGRGDMMESRAILMRALILGAGVGVMLVVFQRPIAWIGFSLLHASEAVTGAAKSYFDIRIWSASFALANYAVLGTLIGRGKTGIALGLQILINLSNIVFNFIFVYGLSMSVRGSALGTVLAEMIGMIAGFASLTILDRRWFSVDLTTLKNRARLVQMMAINRDLMIRTAAVLFGYAFFTSQGARGGDILLAANAILMNLYLAVAFFLDGIAVAAQQLCGQAFGAGDGPNFRAAVRLTAFWSFAFAASLCLLAYFAGHAFIDFITPNEAVRAAAWSYMPYAAAASFFGALAFEFDGVFMGAAWTRDMRNMMFVSVALYLLSFAALRGSGNTGLWLAFLIFLSLRGLTLYWRYRTLVREAFPSTQASASAPMASASSP